MRVSVPAFPHLLVVLIAAVALACSGGGAEAPGGDADGLPPLEADLDFDNLAAWHAAIWPGMDERGWEAIDWLPTFHEGLQAADAAGKPLVVWVMNGHPLGCT